MTAAVIRGDAAHIPLPDESVDLVLCSPPFWQLRSYTDDGQHYDGQIGSEPTWQEYIDSLLDCTRDWMRVLKPSGSLFIELGDKYSDRGHGPNRGNGTGRGPQGTRLRQTRGPMEKCLMDLPHRYAIRCVDDLGLIKRAEIIWHHVNGLPESVRDRVRRAHSVVFHFTLQPRYYAAVDEIREAASGYTRPHNYARPARGPNGTNPHTYADTVNPLGALPGSVWDIPSQPLTVPGWLGVDHFAAWPMETSRRIISGWSPPGICTACGQGRRPVLNVTNPRRSKEYREDWQDCPGADGRSAVSVVKGGPSSLHKPGWRTLPPAAAAITGYVCACPAPDAPTRPAVILDPFGGTGTTMLVASALGRAGIGVDRSADYCRLARWRISDPGERAKAMQVPKPPPVPAGQVSLFDLDGEAS